MNTQILILKSTSKTVTPERKYGVNVTITDDIEDALLMVLQRYFDILIIDNELESMDKTRMKLLSGFHLPDLIVSETGAEDTDFSKEIADAIRNKTIKNFGQFELHEKN